MSVNRKAPYCNWKTGICTDYLLEGSNRWNEAHFMYRILDYVSPNDVAPGHTLHSPQ